MDTFPPLWAEGPPAGPTGGQFLSCTAQLTIHTIQMTLRQRQSPDMQTLYVSEKAPQKKFAQK